MLDQRAHLPVEERQQQRADVRAVDVGVGHDDDRGGSAASPTSKSSAPMPQPSAAIIVLISSLPSILSKRAFSTFRILPLIGRIAWKRAVAALLGRAAGRLAFDDVDLAQRGIALLAVGELAGQRAAVERALAAHEIARLARRLARPRRVDGLRDDPLGDRRVLLEERAELVVDDRLDDALDLGVAELGLGLAFELRLRDLDADDARSGLRGCRRR